jgi:anthranilate synthase component 1
MLQTALPRRMLDAQRPSQDLPFRSNTRKEDFLAAVEASREYIRAGDIIQVVLSQRFEVEGRDDPLQVYRALRSINPSPYMFCLELGDIALAGSSPEVHVRNEERRVDIRPIAGTRKRGADEAEDRALELDLLADPKERAEHVMLVDLARNDIGRVCDWGSVKVTEFMIIERYSHVMHIVSNVRGQLRSDRNSYDLMRATFPAGTLSGAPKIRAMEIIAELEPDRRGPYGGAVGYFGFDGNLDCCITIRTCFFAGNRTYVQAGAGLVADSVAESEYEETVNKAKGMMKALSLARGHEQGERS